jgi:hypothetical protein
MCWVHCGSQEAGSDDLERFFLFCGSCICLLLVFISSFWCCSTFCLFCLLLTYRQLRAKASRLTELREQQEVDASQPALKFPLPPPPPKRKAAVDIVEMMPGPQHKRMRGPPSRDAPPPPARDAPPPPPPPPPTPPPPPQPSASEGSSSSTQVAYLRGFTAALKGLEGNGSRLKQPAAKPKEEEEKKKEKVLDSGFFFCISQ